MLIGALLVPLGALERRAAVARGAGHPRHIERVSFGMLPVAKKDLERLRHMNMLLPRLADPALPPRVVRSLPHRPAFPGRADVARDLRRLAGNAGALEAGASCALDGRRPIGRRARSHRARPAGRARRAAARGDEAEAPAAGRAERSLSRSQAGNRLRRSRLRRRTSDAALQLPTCSRLPVLLLELPHELDERGDALLRETRCRSRHAGRRPSGGLSGRRSPRRSIPSRTASRGPRTAAGT